MFALAPEAKMSIRALVPQDFIDCILNRNHSQVKDTVRRSSVKSGRSTQLTLTRCGQPKASY